MTLHVHHLLGCAPTPLAHYLKALGILRIVAEQKDATARGWWQDEHFCLMTALDQAELEQFFLDDYAPTPFVSPWNKGSGFYAEFDRGLSPLESSIADRFAPFRDGIAAGRAQLRAIADADAEVRVLKARTKAPRGSGAAEKKAAAAVKDDPEFKRQLAAAERKFKALKADLFEPYLLRWRGPHRRWMDAALVWLDDGRPAWPSLLGTGGNDGRLDFTNNGMQRLGDLFDLASATGAPLGSAASLLRESLWRAACNDLVGAAIGQFHPGAAGGANSTSGPEGDGLVNPWDFVLMLEGSIMLGARATRRLDSATSSRASAPFSVRAHGAGHPTRGREKMERGEQWMPLWRAPTTARGLEAMLGEGRVQLGKQVAHRPIDVGRAISRLGVARGITSFMRFAYLERNGQSKVAVPVGRIDVRSRGRARLLDDIAGWMDRIQRLVRDDAAPARLIVAEARLANAAFQVAVHDDSPDRWQDVLLAACDVESVQASGTGIAAGPIPPLGPEWLAAANDGSAEWRLACALGSAAGRYRTRPYDPVRHHWLPLQPRARSFRQEDRRLARDPRVVMFGRDAVADWAALVDRRMLESAERGSRHLPLVAARGLGADPADLAQFVDGHLDLERTSALARALMAVRWDRWRRSGIAISSATGSWPTEAWMAVRLACLPWPLDDARSVAVDQSVVRRLIAGDASSAFEVALQRLRAAGLRAPLSAAYADEETARRWAASLAFPISRRRARQMARRFETTTTKEIR